jgi:transcriptional regulator with XRE-family HTH domain
MLIVKFFYAFRFDFTAPICYTYYIRRLFMNAKRDVKKDIYMVVGENISIFRKKGKMNLTSLAKKSGISASFLGNIEKGARKPTLYTIEKIASALGIGVTALFSYKEKDSRLTEDSRVVFEIMKLVTGKNTEEKTKIMHILGHL